MIFPQKCGHIVKLLYAAIQSSQGTDSPKSNISVDDYRIFLCIQKCFFWPHLWCGTNVCSFSLTQCAPCNSHTHTTLFLISTISPSYVPSLSASYKTPSRERRSITCFFVHPLVYSLSTNIFNFLQTRKQKMFVFILPGSIMKNNCLPYSQIIL